MEFVFLGDDSLFEQVKLSEIECAVQAGSLNSVSLQLSKKYRVALAEQNVRMLGHWVFGF